MDSLLPQFPKSFRNCRPGVTKKRRL